MTPTRLATLALAGLLALAAPALAQADEDARDPVFDETADPFAGGSDPFAENGTEDRRFQEAADKAAGKKSAGTGADGAAGSGSGAGSGAGGPAPEKKVPGPGALLAAAGLLGAALLARRRSA